MGARSRLRIRLSDSYCLFTCCSRAEPPAAVQLLRCERLPNPDSIATTVPHLNWELRSAARGRIHTAVLGASTPEKLATCETRAI
jgi:hypothetical protein